MAAAPVKAAAVAANPAAATIAVSAAITTAVTVAATIAISATAIEAKPNAVAIRIRRRHVTVWIGGCVGIGGRIPVRRIGRIRRYAETEANPYTHACLRVRSRNDQE